MIGTWTVVGIRHLTHNQVVAGSSPAGPGGAMDTKVQFLSAAGLQ